MTEELMGKLEFKRPCNFKDCDGIMEVFPCQCWECKKCKRTDGTECDYM